MSIKVEIVTPMRKAFEGEVNQVQVPGWLGELGVLPGHAALLALSRAGVATLHAANGTLTVDKEPAEIKGDRRLVLGPGFVEVNATSVTLVVDLCEDGVGVDKTAAAAALQKAEAELSKAEPNTAAWTLAQRQADLARARLAV